ncbi:MAG: glycosyltransferase [Patescibacteria group bacterium]
MHPIFLSVIIPAYKEGERIGSTLLCLDKYFHDKPYSYEIIVVNDGSPDDTATTVLSYRKKIKNLKLIDNPRNKGKGYAVQTGMLAAHGEYKLFMDADNSVTIDHVERFLDHAREGHDVVIGSIEVKGAIVREGNQWYRRILGAISKVLVRFVAVPYIRDTQRGFKLFTRKAADVIFPAQTIHGFGFDMELLLIAQKRGYSIKELPVKWINPAGSTVSPMAYVTTFKELMQIKWNSISGVYDKAHYPEIHYPAYAPALSGGKQVSPSNFSLLVESIKESAVFDYWRQSTYDANIVQFSEDHERERGKGFFYQDDEFVHHTDLHHHETAFYVLMQHQKTLLGVLALVLGASLIINWHTTVLVLFATLTILYFADLLFGLFLVFRSLGSFSEIKISSAEMEEVQGGEWPTYTIFCPLYKEWQVVEQFAAAMGNLDYPKDKLQILFLLEADDQETIRKISSFDLPSNFEIVVVPHSFPKTKPKAMNYGLAYAKGEYLVVYDAEDVPERDQLKKAVLAFKKSSPQTVCVQAKLNFYNPKQNLLTRVFTAEYSLWFDLILPGLQSINAPIPLGGTSNHFRTEDIKALFGWDAFNVTEDCDLGMRIVKRGLRTAIVDSTTYEEANSGLRNWYRQRSRWIKGYIQTYLVHMRAPRTFAKMSSPAHLLGLQLIVGGKVLSMFINPLMWGITIAYFAFRAQVGETIESFFPDPILYIGLTSFVFGNFLYLYYYMIGCAKRGLYDIIKYAFLVPFYWLGMSMAAWQALYEIIVKPHYWAKTVHGLHLKLEQKLSSAK